MDKNEERWADILGLEGSHQVSTHGRVRSLPRKVVDSRGRELSYKGKMISIKRNVPKGYIVIPLRSNGNSRTYRIHREVLRSFTPKESWKEEVNHKDGNGQNNNINNLEWVTPRENSIHAVKNGLMPSTAGENNGMSKLKTKDVVEIKRMLSDGNITRIEISKLFPVGYRAICDIARGKTWGCM